MKAFVLCAALSISVTMLTETTHAKGCLKGAVVGGAVGHYAGRHGTAGAVVGCAIGHHEARKHERQRELDSTGRAQDH
jgi:uncharacterized protein YcfJ